MRFLPPVADEIFNVVSAQKRPVQARRNIEAVKDRQGILPLAQA